MDGQARVGRAGLVEDRQDRHEQRGDPILVARDAGDDPHGRAVGGDEPGLGRRLERVDQLVEGRRLDAIDVDTRGVELRDEIADRRLEGRISRSLPALRR